MTLWRRAQCRLLQFLCIAVLQLSSLAHGSEYHGQVFCGAMPVPGATVVLTRGDQRFATITDRQGLYEFPDVADGPWKIHIDMQGFVPIDADATIGPDAPHNSWQLKLLPLAQIAPKAEVSPSTQTTPELSARTENGPGDSVSDSDAPSSPQEFNEHPQDEGLVINGSANNASTSPFRLPPGFGNRRPGSKELYTGGIGAIFGNSVLDARPDSLTGLSLPKPLYSQLTGVFTLGGPLKIPHLLNHGPTFFFAYERMRDRNAVTQSGLVPTPAERIGDLSGLRNAQGQPVTIYDPASGLPVTGQIPVSPQAQALLKLYPLPNVSGQSRYNYQTQVLNNDHLDALQLRLDKSIARKDQIYGSVSMQSSRTDNTNLFHFLDTTSTLGIDSRVNWSHLYRHEWLVLVGYRFTRLRTSIHPEFANRENVSGDAGILGNDQHPTEWGPPTLGFASGISSLSDAESLFNRNRTDELSVKVSETRWHHTLTFGGDFRKQEFNERTQQNPRGVFTFTGAATSANAGSGSSSGSDLADFLFGIPDTSTLAFGNADKYFREPVYDAYVTDDWRLRPELSINAGIRWEYGAPISELFGRLVNLDVAPGFSSVAPVVAMSPAGSLTAKKYPNSLIWPDKRGFQPRVGIAWRPIPASTLVVRAGYGIYDDTSVYLPLAEMMAQQAPLSTSLSLANSGTCNLTLANGFPNCAGFIADQFGIDPNFRVGYAQVWQLSMQRDLPGAMVVIASYMGIKGTDGLQEFLPNTYAPGAQNPCSTCPLGFVYARSGGNSSRQAGRLQLRRRLRRGVTASLDYTYAKAIDDDAQVGALGRGAPSSGEQSESNQNPFISMSQTSTAPPMIAQNWLNLTAERGLSAFDQRHLLKAQVQYTTGMGLGGGTLLSGWRGRFFKEWTVLTALSVGTGLQQTPIFLAAVPGTGVTGTIRPDPTGAPVYAASGGRFLNVAAYSAPITGRWGTAGRGSVTGPGQFGFDASLSRTFRFRTKLNLDVRADAINVLNHPVFTAWDTTVNSATFGSPVAVRPMRSMQVTGRLRF